MALTKLKQSSLILVKNILTKECTIFNSRLSSGMSSVLTRIHRCFIWQLHYFISILFPILSHRYMKRGTYIASHKMNLLNMEFIELVSSFYYKLIKHIEFCSIFPKWWRIVFVVSLTKETLKILYSFRNIVRNSEHLKSPKYTETKKWTNPACWNGDAKSYLLCHGAIVFHSKWV